MIENSYEGYMILAAGSAGPFTVADREIDDTGRIVADHPLGTFAERSTAQVVCRALKQLHGVSAEEARAVVVCLQDHIAKPAVSPKPTTKKKAKKKTTGGPGE